MRPKVIVLFLLLVLAPLAALGWLGARVSKDERENVRRQFDELLTAKLKDFDQALAGLLAERERQFLKLTEFGAYDTDELRSIVRTNPLVSQLFVLGPAGELVHPPPVGPLNTTEQEFLKRARHFLTDRQVLLKQGGAEAVDQAPAAVNKGWYSWYWENGPNLVFWRRAETGHIVGVELDRARLLADVMNRLPQTDEGSAPAGDRVDLLDSNGAVLYQWGRGASEENETPRAELALSPPLNTWHLNYYSKADPAAALRAGERINLAAGIAAVSVALLVLAFYFYREYSRDVRLASQRVSFVNQVSHELKTPLTNIRMYAELLQEHHNAEAEEDARPRQYLDIIVSESQRLSRLIANVLTLARQQKKTLAVHPTAGQVDQALTATLEQFRPALEARGLSVRVSCHAPRTVCFDADALNQILGNLLSNVEKYAADGGFLEVASQQEDGRTHIVVSDHGPGIPAAQRERIFEPFYRIGDKLNAGVTGTGIGLTIARELARLHGGDLTLEPTAAGAAFRVTLATPPAVHPRGTE